MSRQLPKSNLEEFQGQWASLTPWARSQNISLPDIQTVAQMDYNRLLEGSSYIMSRDEAMSALLSLKQGSPITKTPGSEPVSFFSNPLEAIDNNVQGLVSGLFHLPETLFGQAKEAVEHPSSIYRIFDPSLQGTGSVTQRLAQRGQEITQAPLVNLLPFVSDIGNLMSSQGRAYLSENPITALLDLGGVGKIADLAEGVARGAGFDSAADLLQKFPDAPLTSGLKAAWAKMGELQGQNAAARGAFTFQDFVNNTFRHFGISPPQREFAMAPLVQASQGLTVGSGAIAEELSKIRAGLNDEDKARFDGITQQGVDPITGKAYKWNMPEDREALIDSLKDDRNFSEPLKQALTIGKRYEDAYQADYLGHDVPGSEMSEFYGAMYEHTNGDRELVGGTPDSPDHDPIWDRRSEYDQAHANTEALRQQMLDQFPSDTAKATAEKLTAAEKIEKKAQAKLDKAWNRVAANRFGYYVEDQFYSRAAERAEKMKPEQFNQRIDAAIQHDEKKLTALNGKGAQRGLTDAERKTAAKLERSIARRQRITPVTEENLPGLVDAVLNQDIYNDTYGPAVKAWYEMEGPKIRQEIFDSVQEMRAAGVGPMMLPRVDDADRAWLDHPTIQPTRPFKPQAGYTKSMTADTSIHDTMIGLEFRAVQILRRNMQREYLRFAENLTKPSAGDGSVAYEAIQDYISRHGKPPETAVTKRIVKDFTRRIYAEWDPDSFVGHSIRGNISRETRYIRRDDLKLMENARADLDKMMSKTYNRAMGLFRFSILGLSPRYFAHITLGVSFFILAKILPEMVSRFKDTPEMFRDALAQARGDMPVRIPRGVSEADLSGRANSAEALYTAASGGTMGKLSAQGLMRRTGLPWLLAKHEKYMEFLENISDMQRALAYVYGTSYATRHNADALLTDDQKVQAGLYGLTNAQYYGVQNYALKVLGDMQSHTPIERTLTRYVIPFYGWTRHVIRFVVQFPFDHPLRAAFMANLSAVALEQDQNLPEYYYRLLFLGQPNQLGDVQVLDYRQWNPLRDVANYMTLNGWLQALNPALQGLVQAAGLDTQQADLYPTLDYNSFYGSEGTSQGSNWFGTEAAAFVPQLGGLEQLMNANSQLRYDYKYNRSKFAYDLADQLGNIPWVPYTLNLKEMTARQEIDQYDVAEQAAQSALGSDSTSGLSGYGPYLPYEGWNLSPGYLAQLIAGNQGPFPEIENLALPYPPRGEYATISTGDVHGTQ